MIKVSSELEFYSTNFEPIISGIKNVFKMNAGGKICIEHENSPIYKTIIESNSLSILFEMDLENSVWKLSDLAYHINRYFKMVSPIIWNYIENSGCHTRIRLKTSSQIAVCINIEDEKVKRFTGITDYFEMNTLKKNEKGQIDFEKDVRLLIDGAFEKIVG